MFRENIKNAAAIDSLIGNEAFEYCLEYFRNHDLINYPSGSYDTGREDISLRIDEYESQIAQERYWQAHRSHIDVYILLRGQERIDMKDADTLNEYHYDRQGDVIMLEDDRPDSINYLTKYGDMAVFYPGEAHKTGIHVELANVFKTALFKIRV